MCIMKKIKTNAQHGLKVNLWGEEVQPEINNPKRKASNIELDSIKCSSEIRIRLLKNGKGKSPVTEIYDWPSSFTKFDLQEILYNIKISLGCGGTIKGGRIEVQGDKCNEVSIILSKKGFKLIRSGG